MTVCTDHIAFGHLVNNRPPAVIAQTLGDPERLLSEMVELEHKRIRLPAVSAGMRSKEGDELLRTLRGQRPLPPLGILDVALSVQRVVLLLVCGSTRATVVVTLAARLSAPSKLVFWLRRATAATRLGHSSILTGETDVRSGRRWPRCRRR
jgi:hypothetical protein